MQVFDEGTGDEDLKTRRSMMLRPRKIMVALTAALVMSLVLTACGGGGDTAGEEGDGGSLTVGMSMPFLGSPFYAVQVDLTQEAAKKAGVRMLQPTDANSDAGKQITDVRNLISGGANGLLVTPRDSDAIVPALDYAEQQGVPVVSMDQGPSRGKVAITVRANNLDMAESVCQEVGEALGGEGKVLELQGDLLNVNGRDRANGFEDCMREGFPNVEVVARPTKWEQQAAADATENVLTTEPDVEAIYMASDSIMLPAVLQVLKRLGKDAKVGEEGHIFLAGIDGDPFALQQIRENALDVTVSQPLDLYAELGVDYLARAAEGETFEAGPTDHDSEIVEDPSGNLADLLSAPVVTKENADAPELWGNQRGARESGREG